MIALFLPLFLAASLTAGAAGLDKGGVTYDFAKHSAERFKAAGLAKDNLVTNADGKSIDRKNDPLRWLGSYCFVHSGAIPDKDPRRKQVRQTVRWSIKDGVFTVVKPQELRKILPEKLLKSTSGGWYKAVNLPHDKGGICRVTFQYRTQIDGAGQVCFIRAGFDKPAGKWGKAKRAFHKVHRVIPSGSWNNYLLEFEVPQGTRSLLLVFRMDGIGKMDFRNPCAVMTERSAQKEKLTIKLSPNGFLDRTFALAKDLPITMCFTWKRNGTPAEAKLTAPVLVAQLPKEITYYGSANLKFMSKKEIPGGVEYRIDMRSVRNRPSRMDNFDGYLIHPLLISSAAAPGAKIPGGKVWVEDQGKRVSNVEDFSFKIIPAFQGVSPKLFGTGFHFSGVYHVHKGAVLDDAAKILKAAGVNWIISGYQAAYPSWRKAGIRYITPELFYIANGYKIGDPKGRPESDKYRYSGDAEKKLMDSAACPSSIYEKRPFFMNTVVPYLRESLKGADGLWANWEPYAFAGRGCFCDTCRRKFAKFVGVSEEQMKKEWPAELLPGRKYRQQIIRFRSLEHAKLMRTVNEVITAATGGEKSLGFIPGVQVDDMSSTWREHKFDAENHPYDYAKSFKWIDPWGPYSHWDAAVNPYVYSKIFSLRIFTKAREVRFAVNKDYPLPNRPKLLAFPHGFQGISRITHPESMKLDILTYFFNGWEGSTVYYFPKGYDARHWKAFAEANTTAAQYEEIVFKGKRVDERVKLTPIQPYAADTVITDHLLGIPKKFSLLQHTAYTRGNTLIAAVFNFWYHGESFFKFQVKGLDPAKRYTVKSSGKRFVTQGGKSFTGRELAAGVTLHAGAVRCVVYEITPETAKDKALKAFTPADLEKFRKAALPALTRAKAVDTEYEKANGFRESKLKDLSNAGISCTADLKNSILTFKSGRNELIFHAPSCTVTAWNTGGRKLICGGRNNGAGGASFWTPVCGLFREGFFVEQKKIKGGIEVTGVREIKSKVRNSPDLIGLYVIQKFHFTDSLKKITVTTTIENRTSRDISFGFRYNTMPAPAGVEGGFTRILAGGKKLDIKRDHFRYLYTVSADREFETATRKIFEITKPNRKMDAAPVEFISPGIRLVMSAAPAKELAGAASWDSGSMQAPTFEPCFKKITLLKGKKVTYSSTLELK